MSEPVDARNVRLTANVGAADVLRPLAWVSWLALAAVTAFSGGIAAPVLIGFPLLVAAIGIMLGQRSGLVAGGLTVVYGAALLGAEAHGMVPADGAFSAVAHWAVLVLAVAAALAMTYFFRQALANSQRETRRLRGELAARVDEIAARVKEIRRSEDKFSRIFQASPVTILISRLESGRYLDVNDAFEQQFGWTRAEAIGNTAVELGLWPEPAAYDRWLAALRQTGKIRDYEALLSTRLGELRQAVTAAEVIDIGDTKCVITLIHDITELRQAVEAVRDLNAALEDRVRQRTADLTEANKELESFSYSISHDLRAPLRGIDGFSHLLMDEYGDRLDAQGREYIERVRRAAQRMGSLIDDLLDLSRVNRHEMRRDLVDLSAIAGDVVEELRKAAPEHAVKVNIEEDCHALGDPQLLRVLLENLLGNAWKYTSKTPDAEVSFGKERDAGDESVFYVRDNGVGFDMNYVDNLFLPFQRLHKTEDFQGSGVGLASAARIVRRHRGRIWAESGLANGERGAIFRFTLEPPA